MKKGLTQTLACATALAGVATVASAQTEQTVTVGTGTLSGFVTDVVLNGNNAVLKLAEQGSTTCALLATGITLKYDETAIRDIEAERPTGSARVYDLQGRCVGTDPEALPRGIYIVDGKKRVVR